MHVSSLILSLLPLLAVPAPAAAAHLPFGKRHAHPVPAPLAAVGLDSQHGAAHLGERRQVRRSADGKRLVKKKRSSCKAPSNSTTSLIGDGAWATPTSSSSGSSSAPSATVSSTSDWKMIEAIQGDTFFDPCSFWSYDDPTHGTVNFRSRSDSWNEGLISINERGNAIMKVDTVKQAWGKGRKSVRIHSNRVWTGGMVLMDAAHMPTGCGTWPAWWQNGPNWPIGGEIDIVEGVNGFSQNQVSLHTGDGCTIPKNTNSLGTAKLTTGNWDSYNCASYATSNQGCGIRQTEDNTSFGPGFNKIGGGVYALVWDKTGIRAWFHPRSNIPADITADVPDPNLWGKPIVHFSSETCDPYTYFYDNYNIFDTTLCGDWAGSDGIWNYAGYAGQDKSCAAITGYSSCSDYVMNNGDAFKEAYWEVSYVKYFNSTSQV